MKNLKDYQLKDIIKKMPPVISLIGSIESNVYSNWDTHNKEVECGDWILNFDISVKEQLTYIPPTESNPSEYNTGGIVILITEMSIGNFQDEDEQKYYQFTRGQLERIIDEIKYNLSFETA